MKLYCTSALLYSFSSSRVEPRRFSTFWQKYATLLQYMILETPHNENILESVLMKGQDWEKLQRKYICDHASSFVIQTIMQDTADV